MALSSSMSSMTQILKLAFQRNVLVVIFFLILQKDACAAPEPGHLPYDVLSAADIYTNSIPGGYSGYVDSSHLISNEGWSPAIVEKFGPIPVFKPVPIETQSYNDGYSLNDVQVEGGYGDGPSGKSVVSLLQASPVPSTTTTTSEKPSLVEGARTIVKGAVARVRTHFRRKVDRVVTHFRPKVQRVIGHFQGKAKRIAERIQARVAKIEDGSSTAKSLTKSSSSSSSSSASQGGYA